MFEYSILVNNLDFAATALAAVGEKALQTIIRWLFPRNLAEGWISHQDARG